MLRRPVALALILLAPLALGLAPPTAEAQEPAQLALRMLEPAPPASATPGESRTFPFVLENAGSANATVSVTANESTGTLGMNPEAWGLPEVPANGEYRFNVTVLVPADAAPGSYELRVDAQPVFGTTGASSSVTWFFTVHETPRWSVALAPPDDPFGPGGEAVMRVRIENADARDVTLQLSASEPGGVLSPMVDDPTVRVPADGSAETWVRAAIPESENASWYVIRLVATRVDGDAASRTAEITIFAGARPAPPPPTWTYGAASRLEVQPARDNVTAHAGMLASTSFIVRTDAQEPVDVEYRLREAEGRIDLTRWATGRITVFPTTSGRLEHLVSLEVPSGTRPGEYALDAEFWVSTNDTLRHTVRLPLIVLDDARAPFRPPSGAPLVDVDAEPAPLDVQRGGEARGVLLVRLLSGAAGAEARVTLASVVTVPGGRAEGFVVEVPDEPVTVARGAIVRVPFTVRAPENATVGARVDVPLMVQASVDGSVSGIRQEAVRVHVVEPVAPPGALGAMADMVRAYPLAFGGMGVAAAALAVAPLWRREWWRYLAIAPLLPLYTRLQKREVLDHKTRERIHQLIVGQPGIHYSALKDATGLNAGALVHHLRTLERHGLVASRKEGILRRFYPVGARLPPAPAVPLTPTQERILALLDERPLTQREMAQALGITQQGVSYHVKTLERKGKLMLERDGSEWRYYRVHDLDVDAGARATA